MATNFRVFSKIRSLLKDSIPTQSAADGSITEEYVAWDQHDQLLLSRLLSSMSDGMLTMMVGCDHAFQVWRKLEEFFASRTKAKVNQFKSQLRSVKKQNMKMNEYLLKVKKIIDNLFAVGCPITTVDHIDAILEGLPQDYNAFVVSVTSRNLILQFH